MTTASHCSRCQSIPGPMTPEERMAFDLGEGCPHCYFGAGDDLVYGFARLLAMGSGRAVTEFLTLPVVADDAADEYERANERMGSILGF